MLVAVARRAAAAVRRASQSYLIALDRHPAPVKAVTASAIAAVGDCLCQAYQQGGPSYYDPSRTLGLSVYALLTTPLVHYWLTYISAASLTRGSAIKRMLADQLLWAPPATACFFYVFGGATLVRKAWLSTLLANWAVWPVIQVRCDVLRCSCRARFPWRCATISPRGTLALSPPHPPPSFSLWCSRGCLRPCRCCRSTSSACFGASTRRRKRTPVR